MKIEQFRRLKKYMMMTMSGSETEVAMAIRKANEAVVEAGTDWNKILDRVVKVELEIEAANVVDASEADNLSATATRLEITTRIREAFETIEESDPRGTWADFIADLRRQWERSGRLTGPQMEALFKGARKAEERR